MLREEADKTDSRREKENLLHRRGGRDRSDREDFLVCGYHAVNAAVIEQKIQLTAGILSE